MSLAAILGTLLLIIAAGALVGLPLIAGEEQLEYATELAAPGRAKAADRGRRKPASRTGRTAPLPPPPEPAPEPAPGLDLTQLRDLEYDYRMGKMSEADYLAARAELLRAGASSDAGIEAELEREIEAAVRAELELEAEAAVEAEIQAELEAGPTETRTDPAYCPECGARLLRPDQKFCHQCGRPITPSKRL